MPKFWRSSSVSYNPSKFGGLSRIAHALERPRTDPPSDADFEVRTADADFEPDTSVAPNSADVVRVAELSVIPAEFQSVGAGLYRRAHAIWELRAAEDDEGGYTLTRKREELSSDLRGKKAFLIRSGEAAPVIVINVNQDRGEAEVVEDMSDETGVLDALDLDALEEPETDAAVPTHQHSGPNICPACAAGSFVVPLEMLMMSLSDSGSNSELVNIADIDDAEMEMHADSEMPMSSGMTPRVLPSSMYANTADHSDLAPAGFPQFCDDTGPLRVSEGLPSMIAKRLAHKYAQREEPSFPNPGFGHFAPALGTVAHPRNSFTPTYHGGALVIDPDDRTVYEVVGSHIAEPATDKMYGVPNPTLPHPNALSGAEWSHFNQRVRLHPINSQDPNETVFVTPQELEEHFDIMDKSTVSRARPKTNSFPLTGPQNESGEDDTVISDTQDIGLEDLS